MIENYIKVLTSKNYQQQMKISIDNATETLKDVLREIESFRESPRTYALSSYLPSYQCAKKTEYTIGKAGIGPFALNNAHHVLTQLVQMRMATNAFTRTYDIDRLDKQYDNDGSGTRILDWLSALINAFVDIAKDPFVIRLNVNAYTYNITAYLIRMGYGRDTFYLLNQPIIVELAKNILNVRGNFGKPKDMTQYELEQSIIYETLRKYGVDYDHIKNRIKDFIYDNGEPNLEYEAQLATEKRRQFEGFRKVIRKEANQMEMRNAVQDAALLFFLFNKYASSVANLVKYSKIDTKKHGKSIAEWNAYLQGMEDLTTDEFFGEGEVERFYRSTFIWKKTYNTITWALSFNQVMLRASESFQNRLQNLLKVLGKKSKINPDVLNKIVNSMEAGIKAGFINEAFYATGRYDDLCDVFYGDYSVPRRLLKLKSDIKQGKYPDLLNDDGSIANEFLNYLFPNVYKNVTIYEQPDFVDTRMSTTLDINMQNEIIYSWDELLHYPNDEVRELAEDLIYYAFYTSGDQTNPNSFFRFVPFSWREGYVEEGENQFNAKGYASYIQNLLTNDGDINYSMLYDSDVFLNNWQDEVLVPTIPESVRTQVIVNGQLEYQTVGRIGVAATSVIEGTDLHPMILFMGDTNPKSEMYIKPVAYEIVGIRRIPIFSPYVKMQYTPKYNPNGIMVYKLIGVNIRKTESGTYYTPIYSLVNKKGYNYKGHWIVEYGTSANFNFNTFLDATFQPISEDDLRSQRLMEYISRSIPNQKLQQYLLSFFSRAVPISQYYGMLDMQDFSSSKLFESYTQDDSADDSSSFVQSTKAPISAEDELDKRKPVTSNADGYVLHSGGAPGGDTWWSKIAEEFGIPNTPERQHHYYAGERSDSNAPLGNVMTSVEDVIEGSSKAAQAAKANWGYQYDYMKDPRLVRDWSQVKYADAVFAIGHLVKPGERIFPNQKNDTRTAKQFAVAGGTGYAVEMAIQAGKPVYVYDQERKQWYKNIDGKWSKSDVPTLTKNFAGIGTRQINQDGINAIRQVFQKTFNRPAQTQNTTDWNQSNGIIVNATQNFERNSVERDTKSLYIFTDNTDRSSGATPISTDSRYYQKYGNGKVLYYPTKTQAVIRGLDNAMPISTQHWYHEGAKGKSGRWYDSDIEEFTRVISEEIQAIKDEWSTGKYNRIVIGVGDAIFNGAISEITQQRTPKLYAELYRQMSELSRFVSQNPSQSQQQQSNTINVWSSSNENADLSNFAIRPFTIVDGTYQSVEQAFQAQKYWYTNRDAKAEEILNKIKNTTNGAELRKLGRQFDIDVQRWDSSSERILKNLMLDSFDQNPEAKKRLLDTGDVTITHNQARDKYRELFPRLLMEVREELRNQSSSESNIDFLQEASNKLFWLLNEMGYTQERIYSLVHQFIKQNGDNIDSQDKLENEIRKFICNL